MLSACFPIISSSSFIGAVIIFCIVLNFSSSFFDFLGPIPGKPSIKNCNCSFLSRVCFFAFKLISFSFFLERMFMNFAVSSAFFVKINSNN